MFKIEEIKKFILVYGKKILFPSFANRITSAIVFSGLGIIVTPTPFKVVLYNWLIEVFNLYSVAPVTVPEISSGSSDYFYGLLLIIIGLIFNIIRYTFDYIESERKLANRIDLLKNARAALSNSDLTNKEFRHMLEYSRIKEYLSNHAIKAVEGSHTKSPGSCEIILIADGETRNSGINPFRNKILDELATLEKNWGVI